MKLTREELRLLHEWRHAYREKQEAKIGRIVRRKSISERAHRAVAEAQENILASFSLGMKLARDITEDDSPEED